LGGEVSVENREISLAEDTIERVELEALSEWLLGGNRLTKGPITKEFEEVFAKYIGSRFAIMVNSGSSANLLMIYALQESGRLRNNKVVAPAVSWVTTVAPLMQFGFDVHLCDCNPVDLGLDIDQFEWICKVKKPSMAILVHVLGHANDMGRVMEICDRYGVTLLEDACEALGSVAQGRKLGGLGKAGSYSFYYGHQISTIEGGMVVTDDSDLYARMLSIRSHGWARDVDPAVHAKWRSDYDVDEVRDLYTFYHAGFNLRSTDLNAFLGLSQIKKIDRIVDVRERNFGTYRDQLGGFWSQSSETDRLSHFAYGVLVENRLETYQFLKSNGVETRPLICGSVGRHPFWVRKMGRETRLPNADVVHDYGLYLPNHCNLSVGDIRHVARNFKDVAKPKFFKT